MKFLIKVMTSVTLMVFSFNGNAEPVADPEVDSRAKNAAALRSSNIREEIVNILNEREVSHISPRAIVRDHTLIANGGVENGLYHVEKDKTPSLKFSKLKEILSIPFPEGCGITVIPGNEGVSLAMKDDDGVPFQLRADSSTLLSLVGDRQANVLSMLDISFDKNWQPDGRLPTYSTRFWVEKNNSHYFLVFSSYGLFMHVLDHEKKKVDMQPKDWARISRAIDEKGRSEVYTHCHLSSEGQKICVIDPRFFAESFPDDQRRNLNLPSSAKKMKIEKILLSNFKVQNAEGLGVPELSAPWPRPWSDELTLKPDFASEGQLELDVAEIDGKKVILGLSVRVMSLEKGVVSESLVPTTYYEKSCFALTEATSVSQSSEPPDSQ